MFKTLTIINLLIVIFCIVNYCYAKNQTDDGGNSTASGGKSAQPNPMSGGKKDFFESLKTLSFQKSL